MAATGDQRQPGIKTQESASFPFWGSRERVLPSLRRVRVCNVGYI